MKLKVVYRKLSDYIRYDLKEIILPSSLPDPPHVVKRPKLTWSQRFQFEVYVLKKATRLYCASFVRDIGPELRPNDYKKQGDAEPKKKVEEETEKEPSVYEDLAVAARGGMETLRPALHRLYMTKGSQYRDALTNFIQGYHEGLQEVLQKKEESEMKKEETEVSKDEVDNSKKTN